MYYGSFLYEHCDNTRFATSTQEKSPQRKKTCRKCPVASVNISTTDDYWWCVRVLKGCPTFKGGKSVKRGKGVLDLGLGVKIGIGIMLTIFITKLLTRWFEAIKIEMLLTKSPSLKTYNTFHNCQILVEMDCLLTFSIMYVLTWIQWLTWYDLALLEGLHEAVHLLLRQEQIQIILQQKGETRAETYPWWTSDAQPISFIVKRCITLFLISEFALIMQCPNCTACN